MLISAAAQKKNRRKQKKRVVKLPDFVYNICLKNLFLEGRSVKRLEIAALYTDAAQYAGQTVTVCGWVKTIRDSKALGFIELMTGAVSEIYKWCWKKTR